MISKATQRAYDILIAMRVYGWYEETFTLVRGINYNEEPKDFPIKTGEKKMLVPFGYAGEKTMWWHQYDEEREKNVPNYTADPGLAAKLMMRTAQKWGWQWFMDMDESRCAIRLLSTDQEITFVGPFAMAICVATIKALGIEVPEQ